MQQLFLYGDWRDEQMADGRISKSFRYEGKVYNVKGSSEKECLEKIAEKKAMLKRGEFKPKAITVQAWAETWLETYLKPKVRKPGAPKLKGSMTQKSFNMYDEKLRGYILPAIGRKKLADIRDSDLQRILNDQAETSFSHASKVRMILKAMFKQAYVSRQIMYDPSLALKLPAVTRGKGRSITEEERTVLLEVAKTHRCGLLVKFMLYEGLRPGELAALRVKHLDFKKGLVSVEEAVESGSGVIGTPKTDAGIRYVFISEQIKDELKAAVEGKDAEDFVFPQTDGKSMMTDSALQNNWRSFVRQMDLAMGAETTIHGHIYDPKDLNKDGTPIYPDPKDKSKPRNGHKIADDLVAYCLRHTFCTDLVNSGVPIEDIKYLMGHEDISTTANTYSHPGEESAERAAKIIQGKSNTDTGK